MKHVLSQFETGSDTRRNSRWRGGKTWLGLAVLIAGAATTFAWNARQFATATDRESAPPTPLPSVSVSTPLQQEVEARLQFLGQFAGVEYVELRAQVGGTLTQTGFKDGDIVQKGDLLFAIDPEPYQIKLNLATAQLEVAKAKAEFAASKVVRAESARSQRAISSEEVDERAAEKRTALANIDAAEAMVRDARFDLDHCRIPAPFTGRIGSHLVSVGNLIAGSRAAGSPTTLLATIVSLDPIYLNFDMSESDYMAFMRARGSQQRALADTVELSLSDETAFTRKGTLEFMDNTLNRSSGTIRARVTVPNHDLLLRPGGFARVRLPLSPASPALLVPDSAVLPDQSEHVVMTVGSDGTVAPKIVKLGDLRGGLRVVRSGLAATDRVVIDGIPTIRPGLKVATSAGSIRFNSDRD